MRGVCYLWLGCNNPNPKNKPETIWGFYVEFGELSDKWQYYTHNSKVIKELE